MDDYSNDATEMKTQTDPGTVGSESLAQNMAGELERIRYTIAQTKGQPYWYSLPSIKNVRDPGYGAVGDGLTDDTTAINNAVADCSSGDTVYFPAGTYLVSANTVDECVLLTAGVNLIMARGAWLKTDSTAVSLIAALGDNIIQANLDGNGYPAAGGVKGVWTLTNAGIRSYFSTAIGLGAENVIIRDSEIKNCNVGVQPYGVKNWRIYGNKFHRIKTSCILAGFGATGGTDYDCKYNLITGNVFEDAGDDAVAFFQVGGYSLATGAYNTVANNFAKNMNQRTNGYAYAVEAGDPDYQHHFLFANNVYECDTAGTANGNGGISISTCADSAAIGNVLTGCLGATNDKGINAVSQAGEEVRGCLIEGNSVDGFRGGGIVTDGGTEITITGNNVKNCGDTISNFPAIGFAKADDASGIAIENNTLTIESTYAHYGVGVPAIGGFAAASKTLKNITIKNNTIINPNDLGIQCLGTAAIPASNINICGNDIMGTGDAQFFKRQAIYADYCNDVNISGNTIFDATQGIVVSNAVKGVVGENDAKGSVTMAWFLDLLASTDINFRGNEVSCPLTAVFNSGSLAVVNNAANNIRATGTLGFIAQNKGVTSAIASGATVTHGMDVTPTNVQITPANSGVTDWYAHTINSTTFTITYSGGGTKAFYWRADF